MVICATTTPPGTPNNFNQIMSGELRALILSFSGKDHTSNGTENLSGNELAQAVFQNTTKISKYGVSNFSVHYIVFMQSSVRREIATWNAYIFCMMDEVGD